MKTGIQVKSKNYIVAAKVEIFEIDLFISLITSELLQRHFDFTGPFVVILIYLFCLPVNDWYCVSK